MCARPPPKRWEKSVPAPWSRSSPRSRIRNEYVRKAAAEALGKIGDTRAVEPLIAALKTRDSDVRQAAAEALGKIGDARAVEPLIAALKDEDAMCTQPPPKRWEKSKTPAPWSRSSPRSRISMDRDGTNARSRRRSAGKIGDAHAVEPLIAALKDENKDVRQAAAAMLGRLGWQPGRDEAAGWYWMVKGDWDKCVALGALAVEPLIAALKDGVCASLPPRMERCAPVAAAPPRWEKSKTPAPWSRSSPRSRIRFQPGARSSRRRAGQDRCASRGAAHRRAQGS
jgi:HEAT repeat protein